MEISPAADQPVHGKPGEVTSPSYQCSEPHGPEGKEQLRRSRIGTFWHSAADPVLRAKPPLLGILSEAACHRRLAVPVPGRQAAASRGSLLTLLSTSSRAVKAGKTALTKAAESLELFLQTGFVCRKLSVGSFSLRVQLQVLQYPSHQ